MSVERRRSAIRLYIDSNGEATLGELCEMFPRLSEMTLRRDLIALEHQGALKRTHGGAVAIEHTKAPDPLGTQSALYVANLAKDLLTPGCATYLDGGEIPLCLARMLGDEPYVIVTPSPLVAAELLRKGHIRVTLLGGEVDPAELMATGPLALSQLKATNIAAAVFEAQAYSVRGGVSCANASLRNLKKLAASKAERIIVTTTAQARDTTLPYTFCELDAIDALVCDAFPGEEAAAVCVKKAVDMIY